jgi:K+-sensing histidine kinase KdpD
MSVRTDWRLYQLIIFNLIQNAVKYNKECGHLTIKINLSQKHRSTNPIGDIMFFETIIQDQGPGISQSRLKEMFNVFGELHQYQSM